MDRPSRIHSRNCDISTPSVRFLGSTSSPTDTVGAHVPVVRSSPVPLKHTALASDVVWQLHAEIVEPVRVASELPAWNFRSRISRREAVFSGKEL